MSRKEYEFGFVIRLASRNLNVQRSIRVQYDRDGAKIAECCIQYELEIKGVHGHVIRFDDSSELGFHEHPTGWPTCPSTPKTPISGVRPEDMIAFARKRILANADMWEDEVLGKLVTDALEAE